MQICKTQQKHDFDYSIKPRGTSDFHVSTCLKMDTF